MQQTSNRSENRATMTLNENPTVEHHLIASLIRTIHRMILKHQMISWGTWTLVGASAGPERGNQWGLTFMSRAKAPKIDNNFKAISGKIPRGCSWTWVIGSWGNQLYWNQDKNASQSWNDFLICKLYTFKSWILLDFLLNLKDQYS